MSLAPASLKRLCVGIVTGPHGVRGAVRVKSFTADPIDIGAYGPVTDEAGLRRFKIRVLGAVKGAIIAELEGIATRDAAEAIKGLKLHVARDQLPPAEDADEFYHADLIGLAAVTLDGAPLGTVTAVHDYGAGQSIEIAGGQGAALMVPFTKAAVPQIDLAAGRLVVDPPPGLFDKPEPPASLEAQAAAADEQLGEGAGL